MDEHNTGDGYSETLHEGYGVVPSNSEYQSFRSVIASAPPILESDTAIYNHLSAQNLIQACILLIKAFSLILLSSKVDLKL